MRQMRTGDLLGTGKFAEKCVNGCHVQSCNLLLQLRKQNCDQTGHRLLQLRTFKNLVKSVKDIRAPSFLRTEQDKYGGSAENMVVCRG